MEANAATASPWKRYLRHLPAVLGVLLLFGAIYVVQKEFRTLKMEDITAAVEGIPKHALMVSFFWTVLAYFILTFYDQLGTIYAGHKVSYPRAAFASFTAYALSHNLGFAAVSGAAVRYRLYAQWGLSPVQIAKTVAFCSLTFGLGGMVLGGIILFVEPQAVPFFGERSPRWVMYAVGAAMWAIVGAYVTLSTVVGRFKLLSHEIELPHWRMAVIQVLLATVDVAATATIMYSLLPHANGLTWLRFLGIYVASYSAGLAASLPGGLGVFDTAILLGLEPYLDAPRIVGAILIFRLYYYIIPLFLAGGLFAGNEIFVRGGSMLRKAGSGQTAVGSPMQPTRWSEPDFAVAAATGAVALCGAMLLSLAVLVPPPDFHWVAPDLAGVAQEAGQFIPSLLGAGLLVLAIGLSQRVNLAWGATLLLLMVAAAFTLAQGERFWVSGVLVLAAALLLPFRSCFYRDAMLFRGSLQLESALPMFALIACILALAVFERRARYIDGNSWWEIVLSPAIPNSVRATIAGTVGVALVATWRLIRPGRVDWTPWGTEARLRLATLGDQPPARADGVVWGEAERSGIAFRRCGGVILGLGDPVGAESDRVSAIWRLRDLAQQEGLDPAFWRTGPDLLKVYGDLGLTAVPLGPDGLPLPEQPDSAPPARQFLVCVAERDLSALLPLLPGLAGVQAEPLAAE